MYQWLTIEAKIDLAKNFTARLFNKTIDTPILNTS